jgi:hypothetical protein
MRSTFVLADSTLLLIESRVSQASFIIPDHLAHSDPLVERFAICVGPLLIRWHEAKSYSGIVFR